MAQMGRPRSFDRNQAIDQAMRLFWQHGYEATSLAQLRAGVGGGISAPSFYAAFASKEALFIEVLERYLATHGRATASLYDASLPPRQAVELALRRSVRLQTARGHPRGCLLVVSALAGSPEHEHVQKRLAKERARTLSGFQACIQRAVDLGELPATTDPRCLATLFQTFLMGLSTMARDGATAARLNAAVDDLMALWG